MPLDHLGIIASEADRLADVAATSPAARPRRYPDWTVRDLVRHTGAVHRWAEALVRTRATERAARADAVVADDDVVEHFLGGARILVATLRDTSSETRVWSFGTEQTAGFWRGRMARETTIHRWDAEDAAGRAGPVDPDLAVSGVEEAVRVYLAPRLEGRDVGGRGQRVRLVSDEHGPLWTVTLRPDGVAVHPPGGDADAEVSGPSLDLWLFTMGRCDLADVRVDGDPAAAALCRRAVDLVPGPT